MVGLILYVPALSGCDALCHDAELEVISGTLEWHKLP
ncbi:hypothetical protein ABIE27_002071 [Paenibacillus sp. 4624]